MDGYQNTTCPEGCVEGCGCDETEIMKDGKTV